MRTMKIAMAAVACALAAGTAQGRTVSTNYTLTQDEDWTADGTVKIENSATIDLNGHNLTVTGVSAYCITNETGVVDGYSDLEYLDTSGSQRILTDFKPADSDVVYMGVKFHEGSRATQMLWCDRSGNTGNTFTGLRESRAFRFDRKSSTAMTGERHAAADNVYYDIVANYSTRECTVNGEPAATMNSTGSYTPATNLVLFASFTISNNGSMTSWGNYADLRFYYLIVERAGEVVAHFVPVKRQSDGVVGVYDRAAGKFYENGNASGSPFTAGSAEITNSSSGVPAELRLDVPEGSDQYQKLEYIEATGKEYILTDYQPNGTDRVEMKVNFTSTEENQCLFCTRKLQNSRSFSLFYIKNQGGVDYEKFRFDYANKQFFGNSVTPNVDIEISIDGDTRENNIGLAESFATASTPGPPFPILLFGAFYEGSGTNALAKAKCYYFKVYDNAGNLKLDMVPARSLDGTMRCGMYDKVAGKFYPSSSKTAFTVHGAAKAGNYLLDNTTVSFTGNMKVVKKGGGIYIASMPDQTYTGGTVVEEGLLKCGAHGSVNPFGADGSAVTVSTNGILDVNGKESFGNYSFILDGGTLGNSFDRTGMYSVNCIQSLALAADSAIKLDGRYTLGGATASTLDLRGNKLTIRTPCAIYFRGVEAISSGTIELHGPRIIEFAYQNTADTNDLRLVDLIVKDGGQLRVQTNVVAKLGGYVSAAAASDNNASYSGKLELYGTFKPDTDYFHGLELQDGATIDLSGRTTPLPLQSLIGANCHPNAKNVTFADNATILVSWGGRTIPTSVPLISWTAETKPANLNTLQFVFEKDTRRTKLMKLNDGIYQPKGFAIYLK